MENFDTFDAVILGFFALLFGIGYNWLIAFLEKRGGLESYTSYLVALGVLITLALVMPLIGFDNFLVALVFFVLTGLPMIIGSSWRYLQKKEQGRRIINDQ